MSKRPSKQRKRTSRGKKIGGPTVGVISAASLAEMLNLSPVTLRGLVADGMPRRAHNQYPLADCVHWYCVNLQNALERKGVAMAGGDTTLWKKEKSRQLTVTAELKELELAQKRGLLVTVADAKKALEDFAHMVKARINATPPRLAAAVLGESSRTMVQALIEKEMHDAMTLIAHDGNNLTPVGAR